MKGLAKFKPGQGMGSIDQIGMPDAKPQSHDKTGAFITHAIYGSQTDTKHMSNNATGMSTHDSSCDPVAGHRKMDHDQLLAERNAAYEKAEPAE